MRNDLAVAAALALAGCTSGTPDGGAGGNAVTAPAPAMTTGETAETGAASGSGEGIPIYRPVRTPAGAESYDIGFEGRLSFADGCIKLVNVAGAEIIPIFPEGTRWRVPGRELEVAGTAFREGDILTSGGSETRREFWLDLPESHRSHVPVPAGCRAPAYLLVREPVGRRESGN